MDAQLAGRGDGHPAEAHPGAFVTEDGAVLNAFISGCPSRSELRDVTGRWAPLVLLALDNGITRFGDLHRFIGGSSERMLSQTLQTLADDEVVARSVDADGRPRYELTAGGRKIAARMHELMDTVYTHLAGRLDKDEIAP